jgi:tetrapyrrole methylase family protein/MazG family protein
MNDSSGNAFARLVDVCRRLMSDDGCPWDREQTLASITPYLQEEAYEIIDAIARNEDAAIREEVGDLFYLLVFASALGVREGRDVSLPAVLQGVVEKLVRRHPHVFGEASVTGAGAAIRQWEELKRDENRSGTTLGHRPPGLPALTTAFRVQEKAAAVNFEWRDVRGALAKLREEIDELEEALEHGESGRDPDRVRDELGDILYSVVNVSRYIRVDPELALRGTISKFMNRFLFIERELAAIGKTPSGSSLEEMDALWNEAKRRGIR